MTQREFNYIQVCRTDAKSHFNKDFENSKDVTDLVHAYARYCGKLEAILDAMEIKAMERGLR